MRTIDFLGIMRVNIFEQIMIWLMFAAFMLLSFWFLAKRRHSIAFAACVSAAAMLLVGMCAKNGMTPSFEQAVCWGAAIAFLVLSFKFLDKGKLGEAFTIVLVAAFSFFCGLTGVQGLLKT